MKRKAILIGASGKEEKKGYLPGVKKDIKKLYDFLISRLGGAWDESEIVKYDNPEDSVIQKLKTISYDYTVTLFSGHGGIYTVDSQQYLEINGIDYKVNNFINKSKRQLIILDCCRGYFEEEPAILRKRKRIIAESLSHRYYIREIYENHILRSEEGLIVLYAASKGQAADENYEGAYFINSLIKSAQNWYSENDTDQVYDCWDAVEQAKEEIKVYPTLQEPEISGSKRKVWFPFGVKERIVFD